MKLIRDRKIRTLILIMLGVVAVSITAATAYYSGVKNAVDPRIRPARDLYGDYNKLAGDNNIPAVLQLLDTVDSIYQQYPHYKHSFETAVLANNRAAVYLALAQHGDSLENLPPQADLPRDSLLQMAEAEVRNALVSYVRWKKKYGEGDRNSWQKEIRQDFLEGMNEYSKENQQKYLDNRLDEFEDTKAEIDRRLSVSYTNLGLVYRHRGNYDSAVVNYMKAMELWQENLTAENNLNVLLNKPKKKRSLLRKLFPPEKDQK